MLTVRADAARAVGVLVCSGRSALAWVSQVRKVEGMGGGDIKSPPLVWRRVGRSRSSAVPARDRRLWGV